MSPKPKSHPPRLGPPVQLSRIPIVQQQQKFQPKLQEVLTRQIKLLARWFHHKLTWKKILMSWMVILVASKMILLILTYQYFSLTALISLQIFHGVWTIAFFCLTVIDTTAILPNASCLLAGYLPATTVLHILLIPNDYPLEFIITDAVGTFLAIITMFLLLRMECTEILHEAEEMWQRQTESEVGSDAGTASTDLEIAASPHSVRSYRHDGVGPTVVQVGVYDSMLFPSMDVENSSTLVHSARSRELNSHFHDSIDLEPIDFEHFVDEPDFSQQRQVFRIPQQSRER